MSACQRTLVASLTVLVLTLYFTPGVRAGWVTIKNDTGKPIVVQEVIVVNGQPRRGKPTNLLAGDTVREFLPLATTKQIDIFDAQKPQARIGSAKLNCTNESQAFSVTLVGGQVTVIAVRK